MKKKAGINISIVIPCLNEEKAVGGCVATAMRALRDIRGVGRGEVIVVDNGSTDKSAAVAGKAGAKIIEEPRKGYGRALMAGLNAAGGDYLIFADGDGSYDFGEVGKILALLCHSERSEESLNLFEKKISHSREILRRFTPQDDKKKHKTNKTFDMVIGSRLKGKIAKGAMPFLHRFIGTPIINLLFRIFFKQNISDVNSGFRGITKKAFDRLRLNSTGMEFASEMLYKAVRKNMRIAEVPVSYHKRIGKSKLSAFRDAWRHLKFMLLFSPSYLFIWPGAVIGGLGILGVLGLLGGRLYLFGRYIDIHSMIVSAFMVQIGFQILFLGLFAKVFAVNYLEEKDEKTTGILKKITLEKGVVLGLSVFVTGISGFLYVLYQWIISSFGALSMVRFLVFSLTFLMLGVQIIFSSFFFGLLGREER